MDEERQQKLKRLLAEMWKQNLPETQARIDQLHTAISAAAKGSLSEEQRLNAEEVAHKLAGALGTYGLREASVSAREIETCFAEADFNIPELRRKVEEVRVAVQQ